MNKTILKLKRTIFTDDTTIGELFLNDVRFCYTLEDRVRENDVKINGETAIPVGKYELIISYSPRFQREMIELLEVKNFRNIRIHGGNTHKDTEGCILVAYNLVNNKTIQGTAEKDLLELVKKELKKGKVYLEVDDLLKNIEGVKKKMITKSKTGIKTTEFWMAVITIIGILLPTISGLVSFEMWAKISAGLVAIYTIGRTIAKITPNKIDDAFIDKIESDIISKLDKEIKKK